MRILITGASGMLGSTFVKKWQENYEGFSTDKKNFTKGPAENFIPFNLLSESYEALVNWAKPNVIIHCAAITNVDYCEQNPEQAMAVNAESVNKFLKYGRQAIRFYVYLPQNYKSSGSKRYRAALPPVSSSNRMPMR